MRELRMPTRLVDYFAAAERGAYYAWCARKGFPLHRDPLSGRQNNTEIARRAEREGAKAKARVWYGLARKLREAGLPVLP